ncbi:MAG TPA: polysaccharide pyruvyl transferase family protein [Devosia sp.]
MSDRAQIGVLTFHRCINYGSYWQARCLVEGLRSLGHEAVLMDHRSRQVDRAEWRCALHPVPTAPRLGSDREVYVEKARRFFQAFEALPLSAAFPLERPEEAEPFDLILVGSDEVWNLRHPWYGGKPIFYGHGLRGGRLASYAASFGNQDAEGGLPQDRSRQLQAFDAVAVRDENSRRIVTQALEEAPELVLDPCLQFPEQIEPARIEQEEPYIAVYGHSFPGWFTSAVREYAKQARLRLISIGYRNDWADGQWIDADPQQFAGFIAGSAAVATNFFHGCVFSLLNRKPFVCAPSEYRNNKVRDLLTLVGAKERLLAEWEPAEDVSELLRGSAGPETYRTITNLRQVSQRYLDHVLN